MNGVSSSVPVSVTSRICSIAKLPIWKFGRSKKIGSTVRIIPGSITTSLPSASDGGSCTSKPRPWPTRSSEGTCSPRPPSLITSSAAAHVAGRRTGLHGLHPGALGGEVDVEEALLLGRRLADRGHPHHVAPK